MYFQHALLIHQVRMKTDSSFVNFMYRLLCVSEKHKRDCILCHLKLFLGRLVLGKSIHVRYIDVV